jgi:hypothetical protein
METRPKSQAELNSQAMAFASYEVGDDGERDRIATMLKQDVGNVATHDLYPIYAEFLRHTRGNRPEIIKKRTELQANYAEFKPLVDELRKSLASADRNGRHESYIHHGGTANAFSLEKDGREYVVRTINKETYRQDGKVAIDKYVAGIAQAEGMPHLEQIIAASYEDEVTIAERMPGKSPDTMTADEIGQITDDQLYELLNTLKTADDHNIKLDSHAGNYLYDKDEGFGLIDFDSPLYKGVYQDQGLGDKVAQAIHLLGGIGKENALQLEEDGDSGGLEQYNRARLDLLQRFSKVVEHFDLGQGNPWRVPAALENEIDFLRMQLHDFGQSTPSKTTNAREEYLNWEDSDFEIPKAPAKF